MKRMMIHAAALCLVAVATTACAGDGTTSEPTGDETTSTPTEAVTTESEEVVPLKVLVSSGNPQYIGTVGVGIAEGIFSDLGLEVELEIAGSGQETNLVIAGSADLTITGTADLGSIEGQGKDVSAIWAAGGGGLGVIFLAPIDGPSTVDDFTAKAEQDGCRFATTSPGSTTWQYGNAFNSALGLECELVEFGGSSEVISAIAAGRADVGVSTPSNTAANAALDEGQLQILIDTREVDDPTVEALGISATVDRVWMGLADNLEAKKASVRRFIEGLMLAGEIYQERAPEELADLLLTLEVVQAEYPTPEDVEDLVQGIESSKPYVDWNDGQITPEEWDQTLETIGTFGLEEFDPTDPARAYDRVVDMSFYEAAAAAG